VHAPHPRTVVLVVDGPLSQAELPALYDRACELMARPGVARVLCEVGPQVAPDGVAVEALARLQLVARRRGLRVALRHASRDLVDLLALAGLTEIVPVEG
jgi:ABC-type transporter Mla MlaB component